MRVLRSIQVIPNKESDLRFLKLACKLFLIIFALFMANPAYASLPSGIDTLEVSSGFTLSKHATSPFWMWANRQGRVNPASTSSLFTRLRVNKNPVDEYTFDWFYGFDLTAGTNSTRDLVWTDAYAGLAYKNIRLHIGRKAETFGLVDSLLTVGSEVYSHNAPTIPKIAISTNGYVGIFDDLAVNAYLAHGWLGEEQNVTNAYLHQKYLYLRFGEDLPDQGLNFYIGIHHLAVWGGTNRSDGVTNPSGFSAFRSVFVGGKGGSDAIVTDQTNALGNHLGSIEYALQLKGSERDWFFYAHTLFEDVSGIWGGLLVKPGDYFLGASMINKQQGSRLKRINIEYIDTRGSVFGEPDDYFYNGYYRSGWTYQGYGIGHSFISFTELPNYTFIPQNRLQGANVGVALAFSDRFNPIIRAAWIRQQGSITEPRPGIDHYAFALSNNSTMSEGWRLNQELYFDVGQSIKFNPGIIISVTKSFF